MRNARMRKSEKPHTVIRGGEGGGREGHERERACRRIGEWNSTEACLLRRTRCEGARTRRRHAFSTGPTVVRGLHDVDSADDQDDKDDKDEEDEEDD